MNSKDIKGLAVISIADGEKLGTIDQVLVDPVAATLVGFTVRHNATGIIPIPIDSAEEDVIDVDDIHALGKDAVTLNDKSAIRGDQTRRQMDSLMGLDDLSDLKVVTEGGTYIGDFASAEIDETTFKLTEFEVSPGFFKSNRHIPVGQVVNIGPELIMVNDSVSTDESVSVDSSKRQLVVGDV